MSMSPDQWVESHVGPVAEALSSFVFYTIPIAGTPVPLIVMWLGGSAVFCTFYLRFITLRALGLDILPVKGWFPDPTARG